MKLYRTLAASALIIVLLAPAAFAFGPRDHGHGHASAMMPCMVVAQPQQKAKLRQLFMKSKKTFKADHRKLMTAKKELNEAILSGDKNVTSQEEAVTKAHQQLLRDRDAIAIEFCGQLSPKQRTAAQKLYRNLASLREQTHEKARKYCKEAKAAAGTGKPASPREL